MKCSKCGAELSDDTKFCSYCGERVEKNTVDSENATETTDTQTNRSVNKPDSENINSKATYSSKIKDMGARFWNKLSMFGKVATIAIALFTILFFIAFLSGKIFAGIIALVQIVLVVVALLMKKQIIKVPNNFLHILATVLAFVLLVPYVCLLGVNYSNYESNEEMQISVDAPEKLGSLAWPGSEFAKLIPAPNSKVGRIDKDDKTGFVVYVGNTSIDEFKEYIASCTDKGFTVDTSKTDKSFSAKNEPSNKLTVEYQGNNVMCISVYEPEYDIDIEVDCVKNLIFSKYNVEVYVDDSCKGTLNHGATETYFVTLNNGTHTIKFVSAEDDALTGDVKVDISKNESLKFKISCSSSGIHVETLSGTANKDETLESDESSNAVAESTTTPEGNDSSSSSSIKQKDKPDEAAKIALEATFPVENAKRSAVVAITNGLAIDVFKKDRSTYDASKFHSYADTSGNVSNYFMKVNSWGTWSPKDKETWHVDSLILKQSLGNVADVTLDVNFDGVNYVVSNIKGTYGNPGATAENSVDLSEIESGSHDYIYLTVSEKLIKSDRSQAEVDSLDHSKDLDNDIARTTFEKHGKSLYPYGFKCHWILDLRNEEQASDGSWTFKVGVTITNQYGTERDAIADGTISGKTANPIVKEFHVS